MKIQSMAGEWVDHRRIRRNVYRLLRIIRKKGYGQPNTGGVDGNIRRHRNLALYTLRNRLNQHQARLYAGMQRWRREASK